MTMKPVYVPRSYEEKRLQRALLQYKDPKNYELVYKALKFAGRDDLIGYDRKCLIRPKRGGEFDKRKDGRSTVSQNRKGGRGVRRGGKRRR